MDLLNFIEKYNRIYTDSQNCVDFIRETIEINNDELMLLPIRHKYVLNDIYML